MIESLHTFNAEFLQRFRSHPHTTSETFEYASPEKFVNATISGHFGFVFEENSVGAITVVLCLHRFRKMFKIISTTLLKLKVGVFKSSRLKSVYEKLRFRDGLVLTVGLIVKIKLRCEISWNVVWRRH